MEFVELLEFMEFVELLEFVGFVAIYPAIRLNT